MDRYFAMTFLTIVADAREDVPETPVCQLSSIASRLADIEQQVRDIQADLPPSFSRVLLQMQRDVNALIEAASPTFKSASDTAQCADLARLLSGEVKSKRAQLELLFPVATVDDSVQTREKALADLGDIRAETAELQAEASAQIAEQERELARLLDLQLSRPTASPALLRMIDAQLQADASQIQSLTSQIDRIPGDLAATKLVIDRFRDLKREPRRPQKKSASAKNAAVPDSSLPLAIVQGEFETFTSLCQARLDALIRRNDDVDAQCDECRAGIESVVDATNTLADRLAGIEDKVFTMMDACDAHMLELAGQSNAAAIEEARTGAQDVVTALKVRIKELRELLSTVRAA